MFQYIKNFFTKKNNKSLLPTTAQMRAEITAREFEDKRKKQAEKDIKTIERINSLPEVQFTELPPKKIVTYRRIIREKQLFRLIEMVDGGKSYYQIEKQYIPITKPFYNRKEAEDIFDKITINQ